MDHRLTMRQGITYATLVIIVLLLGLVKEQSVLADETVFKEYGNFSMYDENQLKFTSNAVYGFEDKNARKMDTNGNIIWEYTSEYGDFKRRSSSLQNDKLLVGTSEGYVLLLNSTDGNLLKKYKIPNVANITATLLGTTNDVLVAADTYIYAFNEDGSFKWKSQEPAGNILYHFNNKSIISSNNIDRFDAGLYWTNYQDGSLIKSLWQGEEFRYVDEKNNTIYVSYSNTLFALKMTDGQSIWQKKLPKGNVNSVVTGQDGTVYVGMEKGPLYALDPVKHEIKWMFDQGQPNWGNLIVDQAGNLYAAQNNPDVGLYYIYKFSPSGEKLSTSSIKGPANNLQVRKDGSLYFISNRTYYSSSIPVTLDKLTASLHSFEVTTGNSKQLTVKATYSNGEEVDVTSKVIWKSNNTSVATVDNGKITGVKEGTASITASLDGKTQTIAVNVSSGATPSLELEFSKEYVFADLISNTEEFNSVLSKYTSKELKVIIPKKHFSKIIINHTPNVLTSLTVETSRDVRSIKVQVGTNRYDARRTTTTSFEVGIAGLSKGTELVIIGFDVAGNEIERKVIRLREGQTSLEETENSVKSGNYALVDLVSNQVLFNEVLNKFSLEELKIGLPFRYIENPENDIKVTFTSLSTGFSIQTTGAVSKVIIVAPDQNQYEAIDKGNGLYKRDISGLKDGDMVTIQVYNGVGNLVQQEPAFVE